MFVFCFWLINASHPLTLFECWREDQWTSRSAEKERESWGVRVQRYLFGCNKGLHHYRFSSTSKEKVYYLFSPINLFSFLNPHPKKWIRFWLWELIQMTKVKIPKTSNSDLQLSWFVLFYSFHTINKTLHFQHKKYHQIKN